MDDITAILVHVPTHVAYCARQRGVTESVKALTSTFSVSRYRNKVPFGLAVQVWLLTSVFLTLHRI